MEPLKAFVVMFIAITVLETGSHVVLAQQCSENLSNLQACASLVLPGATPPSLNSPCCTALQATNKECLCNALNAATKFTSTCNLPPLDCGISL